MEVIKTLALSPQDNNISTTTNKNNKKKNSSFVGKLPIKCETPPNKYNLIPQFKFHFSASLIWNPILNNHNYLTPCNYTWCVIIGAMVGELIAVIRGEGNIAYMENGAWLPLEVCISQFYFCWFWQNQTEPTCFSLVYLIGDSPIKLLFYC